MPFFWKAPPGWGQQEKLAQDGSKPSYPAQVWHQLPKVLVKAVSDIPVVAVEAKLEHDILARSGLAKVGPAKVRGAKLPWGSAFKSSANVSSGHVVGALTAPLFFSGLKDAQSDDAGKRRSGYAKLMVAGGIGGFAKGVIEGAALKLPKSEIISTGVAKALTSIPGALSAVIVAKSNKDSQKDTPLVRYAKGGVFGAIAGGMRGAFQRGLVKRDLYRLNRPEFYKRLGAAAASNAVGGAASGAVLSALLDWGKSRSKSEQQDMPKTAADEESPPAEGLRDFVEIRPHQERMISKMVDNGGVMVAAHGVGTGKTVASIAAFDRLRRFGMAKKMLVVAPAGLRKNYADSVNKFSTFSTQVMGPKGDKGSVYYDAIDPSKSVTVVSYEMFRQAPERIMEATGADMLLLDEYHKVRDPGGTTYRAAVRARAYAPNFLGLTGSITNNDPSEVATLANLAAGRVLMRPSQFNSAFKQTRRVGRNGKIVTLRNVPQIKKMFGRYVDFLTTEDVGGDMPRKKVEEVTVPMSKEQQGIYDYALQSAGPVLASKIKQNLPMDYKEAAQAFTIIMKARQAANSVGPFKANTTPGQAAEQTPKVRKLLDDTVDHLGKTPDGQVVLYSNLITGGVDALVAGLRLRGIDPAVFVGKDREIEGTKITGDLRDQGVSDFLAGKKKAIVLSSAGAEGLDLRNSTMFQSLDGHFNPERTRQAEARVRRLGGLSHRPPEQREVLVRRYFSAYPEPSFMGRMAGQRAKTTTDQWIHSVANQKHTLNTQLTSAFAQKPATGTNITTANMPKAPVKYIRRWKNDTGEWRYDYLD